MLKPGEVAGKHAVQDVVQVQQQEGLHHVLLIAGQTSS